MLLSSGLLPSVDGSKNVSVTVVTSEPIFIGIQWRIQDFPEEGAPTPRGGGAPTYDFAKFSQKLHEIERIWAPEGGRASPAPPLDPPLE